MDYIATTIVYPCAFCWTPLHEAPAEKFLTPTLYHTLVYSHVEMGHCRSQSQSLSIGA
jgi:hypothetical protein